MEEEGEQSVPPAAVVGGAEEEAEAGERQDFRLPAELVAVLPSDPFAQLDVARKITSIALSSRLGHLEAEAARLRASSPSATPRPRTSASASSSSTPRSPSPPAASAASRRRRRRWCARTLHCPTLSGSSTETSPSWKFSRRHLCSRSRKMTPLILLLPGKELPQVQISHLLHQMKILHSKLPNRHSSQKLQVQFQREVVKLTQMHLGHHVNMFFYRHTTAHQG